MKIEELAKALSIESHRHFKVRPIPTPLLNPAVYTTFGRRLYDIYQKYKIEAPDQREIENLSYLLVSFTIGTESRSLTWFDKCKGWFLKRRG